VTGVPTGAKWTQVRPGVSLTGFPAPSVNRVGAEAESLAQWPFVIRPPERIPGVAGTDDRRLDDLGPPTGRRRSRLWRLTNWITTFWGAIWAPEAVVWGVPFDVRLKVPEAASQS